jgi:hypothetical protein
MRGMILVTISRAKQMREKERSRSMEANSPQLTCRCSIELLTGVRAGSRDPLSQEFEKNTINFFVDQKLQEFAEVARKLGLRAKL